MAETRAPTRQMRAALDRLRRQAPDVRKRALTLSGEAIVSEAQQPGVVPFREGHLRDSHFSRLEGNDRVVMGASVEYAAAVHETHPTKKQWFLRTLLSKGPGILRKSIDIALREKGGARA